MARPANSHMPYPLASSLPLLSIKDQLRDCKDKYAPCKIRDEAEEEEAELDAAMVDAAIRDAVKDIAVVALVEAIKASFANAHSKINSMGNKQSEAEAATSGIGHTSR